MASEKVSAGQERVSPRAQRRTESLGPRALRIGLRTTLLAPLGAAASVAVFGDEGPGLGSLLPLFLALVAVGAVVAFLPWDRLHGTPTGSRILLVWAVLDCLLITVAGRATGATDAALPLAYAVTFVFFAVVLSPGAQVAYLCLMLACFGVVSASTFEPLSFLMLAIVGVVAIFLARELRRRIAAHERARKGAERRWAVVASVSSAARDAEPRRVLEGVVEAIVALGYETAAIHLPGEPGELQVVLPAAAEADPTLGIRTLPDSIRAEVLGKGRDVVVRVKEVDRQAARGLRSSGVETVAATPIVVGDRPEGVLLVASTDPDGISSQEVEAFAMLATTAAMALSNARRAEERREVEERLTDAGAVRAAVLATLSTEVRKPLGAVTETSRALQDTFGNEDRRRLIERLVASATALDITLGGSLDLSLLEASQVELQYEDVDVGELVSDGADTARGLFEGRDLRADVPVGLTVEADRGLLDQAVEHILVTAVASTPPGKAVEVSVSRTGADTTVKVATDTVIPRRAARADPRAARSRQWRRGSVDPPRARVEDPRAAWERATDAQRPPTGNEGVVLDPGRALDAAGARPDRRGHRRRDGTDATDDRRRAPARGGRSGRQHPATPRRDRRGPAELEPAGGRRAGGHGRDHPRGHGDRPAAPSPAERTSGDAAEHRDRHLKKAEKKERREQRERNEQAESSGSTSGATGGSQSSGTTGETAGSTGGSTGGGTGGGGGSVTPAPSPTPPPPPRRRRPWQVRRRAGSHQGQRKDPSPSPSP